MDEEFDITTESLLRDLKAIRQKFCTVCGAAICGHEALMSLAMGFKNAPQCSVCLAAALGHSREALRDHLSSFIKNRSCYNEGWLWANREEGVAPNAFPQCLWPAAGSAGAQVPTANPGNGNGVASHVAHDDAEWDAGDMGCGDLVLELRIRMKPMEQGQILKLTATNPGAEEDIPSWCRMTGNALVTAKPPVFRIRKK